MRIRRRGPAEVEPEDCFHCGVSTHPSTGGRAVRIPFSTIVLCSGCWDRASSYWQRWSHVSAGHDRDIMLGLDPGSAYPSSGESVTPEALTDGIRVLASRLESVTPIDAELVESLLATLVEGGMVVSDVSINFSREYAVDRVADYLSHVAAAAWQDGSVWQVGTFGRGIGLAAQSGLNHRYWISQECYIIDTKHRISSFHAYFPGEIRGQLGLR